MKRIVLLIAVLAALALCASAQNYYIDFHDMPLAKTPQLMPDNYPAPMNMEWTNFFYVTPGLWSAEGAGFWVDPATLHNTVAFMGGPMCNLAVTCAGSIKVNPVQANALPHTFIPVSITMSAGWARNNVIITAYNNGKLVGTMTIKLSTKPYIFSFPATWKVTQLAFVPEFIPANAVYPLAGSVVIYNLVVR